MAAHDYNRQWSRNAINSEAYDTILVEFLEHILSSDDANTKNTIIVLRADHGLQGGAAKSEYSVQIEHTRPWTNIIIPQSYRDLNLTVLETNQRRLASGFDLYKTLLALMTNQRPPSQRHRVRTGPNWSYNLIQDEIPETRTCADGKIPLEWCRREAERTSLAPNFATCK